MTSGDRLGTERTPGVGPGNAGSSPARPTKRQRDAAWRKLRKADRDWSAAQWGLAIALAFGWCNRKTPRKWRDAMNDADRRRREARRVLKGYAP